jgi:peptidoglycan/LPS O-acetylase OafA/YrhL
VATSLAVLAFLLAGVVPGAFMPISVTLVPFCLVIVAAAQTNVQGGRSWLRSRPMVRLGEWSYAF